MNNDEVSEISSQNCENSSNADENDMILNDNIRKLINVNEIQTESRQSFIAAVEQCRPKSANFQTTRQKWYQQYTVPGTYYKGPEKVIEKYKVGDEIDAIEAVNEPHCQDARPRVFDNISKAWTLLDSGSCVSCVPKEPGDVIDPSFRLKAVNGQSIPTFGSKLVKIRIGRKEYEINAIKAEIPQQILGWDLFQKYRLGFEWGSFGDLFITDKKAKIKSLLKFIKIDTAIVQRVESVDLYQEPSFPEQSSETTLFETKCMQELDNYLSNINALSVQEGQMPLVDDIPFSDKIDPDAKEDLKTNLEA